MKVQSSYTAIDNLNWTGLIDSMYSEDSSIECLSLKSKWNGYEISFYAWANSKYEMQVEEFGLEENGKWFQMEPTIDQRMAMEDALVKELQRLFDVEDEKEVEAIRHAQHIKDEMHHRDSVNHNFYRTF